MKNDFSTWLIVLRIRVLFGLPACSISSGCATVQYPWGQGYTGCANTNRIGDRAVKGPLAFTVPPPILVLQVAQRMLLDIPVVMGRF
jgi:hypothetical protein